MPKQNYEKNNFIYNKGLFSEASPLNRPDGTSIDEVNFEILRDGTRRRRRGLENVRSDSTAFAPNWQRVYEWENPGYGLKSILVFHNNGNLLNFATVSSTGTVSYLSKPVTLSGGFGSAGYHLATIGTPPGPFTFASGKGYLFVTNKYITPHYLEYDGTNIIPHVIPVNERDLSGVEDQFGVSTRPAAAAVTNAHHYNLRNQGWKNADSTAFNVATGTYPSNADIWYYGKVPTGGPPAIDTFNSAQLQAQDFGSSEAPKGRFIKNLFQNLAPTQETGAIRIVGMTYAAGLVTFTTATAHGLAPANWVHGHNIHFSWTDSLGNRNTANFNGQMTVNTVPSGTTFTVAVTFTLYTGLSLDIGEAYITIPDTYSLGGRDMTQPLGFNACEFFAGRLFLGGNATSYEYRDRIYYSRLYEERTHLTEFYQTNDPTSEHFSDPLDTDGGFIVIPEVGEIRALKAMDRHLLVFASNGVWAISPGEKGYFTSIDYQVNKLSNIKLFDSHGIVEVQGGVMFCAYEGIYAATLDNISLIPTLRNITDDTIKTIYDGLLAGTETNRPANDEGLQMVYDRVTQRVYIGFNDQSQNSFIDTILCLDLNTQSFFKYTLDDGYPENGTDFYRAMSMWVNDAETTRDDRLQIFSDVYISATYYTRLSKFTSESFLDHGLIDYSSYLKTSYEIGNGPTKKKWGEYVHVFFTRTEDTVTDLGGGQLQVDTKSSCLMRSAWDFTDSTIAGKWGPQQQVYRLQRYITPSGAGVYDNGYPVVVTKNKVRGSGRVLSLHFESETGKDIKLLGWRIGAVQDGKGQ